MSSSDTTSANRLVIPPDARHLAEVVVNARASVRWALTGYCRGQLEILHRITSLDALKRAQDNGDLALLQQYNDRRESMATGPAAMTLMAAERELQHRVDLAALYQAVAPAYRESEAAQEAQLKIARERFGPDGPRTDDDLRAWQEAMVNYISLLLAREDAYDREVFTPIREALSRVTPDTPDNVEWSKPDTVGRWARVYGLGRNAMSKRLRDGSIRCRPVGRRWMVAMEDTPAAYREACRGKN
jgi:hypothetical protein